MITQNDLDFIKLKEARIDYLEASDSDDKPPIQRPLVRIAETAQIFTAMDLYNARAELDLQIEKAEAELRPAIFKIKIKNLKDSLTRAIEEKKKLREQYNDEILILEDVNGLNITEVEKQWNIDLQKKIQEEANKSEVGAEQ